MKQSINIVIIGMGKWGNYMLKNIDKNKKFDIKYICCRKKSDIKMKIDKKIKIVYDENIILKDKNIDCVFIYVQPKYHYGIVNKFVKNGYKVFVEKPFTLHYNEAYKLLSYKKNIMVGNKFIYSDSIRKLKKFIEKNDIKIRSISSRFLKSCNPVEEGIFFDIAYHHIYLISYLIGKKFNKLQKFILSKKNNIIESGIVILDYGDVKCSIDVTFNNHFDFYQDNIIVDTDKGTFYIDEKFRKINAYFDNRQLTDLKFECKENSDKCIKNELEKIYLWVNDRYDLEIKTEFHIEIVRMLEW